MAGHTYEITLAGRVLRVGSEKEAEQVNRIAAYVEHRMQQIAGKGFDAQECKILPHRAARRVTS